MNYHWAGKIIWQRCFPLLDRSSAKSAVHWRCDPICCDRKPFPHVWRGDLYDRSLHMAF